MRHLLKCTGVSIVALLACCSKEPRAVPAATYVESSLKPSWTPDGTSLVFAAWIGENYELALIREDGTGERRLTTNKTYDGSPSVSPDGKLVAYESMLGGDRGIYVLPLASNNPGRIASTFTDVTLDRAPIWLGNGDILFVDMQSKRPDIVRAKSDAQGLSRIAKAPSHREVPALSPDGKRIAFCSKASWPTTIGLMDSAGGNETTLVSATTSVTWPTWSKDCSQLAYALDENGGSGIHVKNLASGSSFRVSPVPKSNEWYWCPEWSPNGEWIVFNAHVGQTWGIAIVKPDGSGYSRIRASQKWEGHPVWSPDSTRIAFHSDADRHIYVIDVATRGLRKVR